MGAIDDLFDSYTGEDESEDGGNMVLVLPVSKMVRETVKAWLIDSPNLAVPEWFPKSQCNIYLNKLSRKGTLEVPSWLLWEKGVDTDGLEEAT